MTITYSLIPQKKDKGFEYRLEDENGRVYSISDNPEGITKDPTMEFLVKYAKLSEEILSNGRGDFDIEIKFRFKQ